MAKRRTAGVQRRTRVSEQARTARLEQRRGLGIDPRIAAIVGFVGIGLVVVLVLAMASVLGGNDPGPGEVVSDAGRGHVTDGHPGGPFSSVPATSGPHWNTPAQWGVYEQAVPEAQVVHNLEHGGIVIWYQPGQVDDAGLEELRRYVRSQVSGNRFKFILSPWNGDAFGYPVALTAWTRLRYVDSVDMAQITEFADAYYGLLGPEPQGGPGPPAQ
jgi:hypothetical protein